MVVPVFSTYAKLALLRYAYSEEGKKVML